MMREWVGSLRRQTAGWTLTAILVVVGASWGFIELADEVVEGDTRALDRTLLLAMRNAENLGDPVGPGWLEEMGRDFTALGGIGVLTLVTLAVSGFLWIQSKVRAMRLLLGAIGTGLIVSTLLKEAFDRPRPDLVPYESIVQTASFPSGHSMMAAVTYLTIGALLARFQAKRLLQVYIFLLACILTILVGLSRVYLGVHWPTDVLAGWTVGAGWALACSVLARWLQRRGKVEPEA